MKKSFISFLVCWSSAIKSGKKWPSDHNSSKRFRSFGDVGPDGDCLYGNVMEHSHNIIMAIIGAGLLQQAN